MGATSTPVLLIHGLDDQNTPPLHSRIIASRNRPNVDLWLVRGAGHTGAFQAAPAEFRYRVLSWLSNRSLRGPGASRALQSDCVKITISKENYLKAIAEAESEGETVIAATLTRWLKVSAPAVTMAIRRLKRASGPPADRRAAALP